MPRKPVVCGLLLLAVSLHAASATEPAPAFEWTHTLQMRTADASDAIPGEVRLVTADGVTHLTVRLPDDSRYDAECVRSSEGAFKFQLVRIAGGKIVAIQFVGTTSSDGEISGRFTGMVDGELRPDMSGTFALTPRSKAAPEIDR
jgi:hypothetical protein